MVAYLTKKMFWSKRKKERKKEEAFNCLQSDAATSLDFVLVLSGKCLG